MYDKFKLDMTLSFLLRNYLFVRGTYNAVICCILLFKLFFSRSFLYYIPIQPLSSLSFTIIQNTIFRIPDVQQLQPKV